MNLYELRQLLLNQLPEEAKSDRETDRETGLVLLRMSEVLLQELKEHTAAFQESGGRELRRVLLRCGNMARTLREIGEQCGSSIPQESARAAQILQERTDLFTNLEQSIQAKEETLKRVSLASAALAQRAAQLAQEESNLMMAEADLQARQKEIREQEARIAELERKMTENSQPKLAEARQRAESLAAALSRQQEELQTLETANAGMEAACAETEKRLAEAQAEQVSLKSRSARGEKELEKTEQRNQRIAAGAEENLCIVCGGQIPEGAETCPACAFPTELPVLLSRRQHEQWLRTVVEPACRAWQKQKAAEEARLRQEEEERQRKAAEEETRRRREEEERQRKAAEEEAKRRREEEERLRLAAEEARKRREELQRIAAEEVRKRREEEERQRKAAEEAKKRQEEEERQRKAAEELRKRQEAEEQQRKLAEEARKRQEEEEQRRKAAEAFRRDLEIDEIVRRAKEEERRRTQPHTSAREEAERHQKMCAGMAETPGLFAAAGLGFYAWIRPNGTVALEGNPTLDLELAVEEWRDVQALAAGNQHLVALMRDGRVLAAGKKTVGQCNVENWEKVSAIYAAGDTTVGIQENGTLLAQGSGAGLIRREITLRNVKAGDLWPFSLATTSAAWIDSKGNFCVMELQGGTPKVLATHLGPRYRPAAGPVPRAYLSNGRLYPNLDLGSSLPLRPLPSSRIRYAWLNWDTCFILTDDGRVHYGLAASRKDKRTKPETGILDARNTLRTSGKIMGFIVLDGGRRLMLVVDRSGKLVRYMYDTGTSQVDRL